MRDLTWIYLVDVDLVLHDHFFLGVCSQTTMVFHRSDKGDVFDASFTTLTSKSEGGLKGAYIWATTIYYFIVPSNMVNYKLVSHLQVSTTMSMTKFVLYFLSFNCLVSLNICVA